MAVFRQFGLYIDGSLGEEYFIRSLKELLDYAWRVSGAELGSLLEDLSRPEKALREPLDVALEYLQAQTLEGLVWIMRADDGSLLLLPASMVNEKTTVEAGDEKPKVEKPKNDDDETKDLSWMTWRQ